MEIELYRKIGDKDPLAAIERMGEWFLRSGMFGCERQEQGTILAFACMSEGMTPFALKRKYHMLNGELSMRADAMIAEFRARGGKHKVIARTDESASIEVTYDGQSSTFSYTWEEAKKEPYVYGKEKQLKKNWATPRARMQTLWARVVSDAIRTVAPEIVAGSYTPEEQEDEGAEIPKAAINLKPAPKPTTVTVSADGVIQGEVVDDLPEPDPSKARRTAPAAPTPPPAPAPAPASAAPQATASEGFVTTEDCVKLNAMLTSAELEQKAYKFFVQQGWLKDGQPVTQLPKKRFEKIMARPDYWLKSVGMIQL